MGGNQISCKMAIPHHGRNLIQVAYNKGVTYSTVVAGGGALSNDKDIQATEL